MNQQNSELFLHDLERFTFHHSMRYAYLESLVDLWVESCGESFSSLEEAKEAFLTYGYRIHKDFPLTCADHDFSSVLEKKCIVSKPIYTKYTSVS